MSRPNSLLLVEDNAGDARLLREMFNEQGSSAIEVTVAECMCDAEKLLARRTFDVILLDLGLPDAQGLEAVRRARAAAARVPLVVLTGVDDESLAIHTLEEGAEDYLVKGEIGARSLRRAVRYATERNSAERKLLDLEGQLFQAQKTEAVGRLAGGVAHDFNNLLMIIQSQSDVLETHIGDEEAIHNDISEIRAAAARGAAMTRQLLAFSRKQIIQPETLEPQEVVAGLHRMLSRLIREDIEFEVRMVPADGFVRIDRGQFEQVLVNLVVNARDAMPKGGRLTIDVRRVEIDESFAASREGMSPGPFVEITVTDTGTGIDAATKNRIFEPFFTTKEVGRGTGLGLATVYGIVKGSGGDVTVDSEPDHGAAFKVYLPLVEAPAVAGAMTTPAPEPVSKGIETLLILEDEFLIRKLLSDYLTQLGYRLLQAGNGDDALRIAREHAEPIDLLLTDVVVPGLSARKVAQILHQENPGMKVVFMSGYTDDAAIVREVMAKEVDFLQKPFGLEALTRKLRSVLDRAA